jgi:hypothetical protein
MIQQFCLKAIRDGADVLQFEPSWYFFDEFFPASTDESALEYPNFRFEGGFPSHVQRASLQRLKDALMGQSVPLPAAALETVFDADQQIFLRNGAGGSRFLNYKQSTLLFWNAEPRDVRALDFYTDGRFADGRQWQLRSASPALFPPFVLDGADTLHRIELTGDYVDEQMVARSNQTHIILSFYSSWGGDFQCPLAFAKTDDRGCTFSSVTAGNFIRAVPSGAQGDPDELLISRKCNEAEGLVVVEVWAVTSWDWSAASVSMVYNRVETQSEKAILADLTGADGLVGRSFVALHAVRGGAVIFANSTREGDRLAVFWKAYPFDFPLLRVQIRLFDSSSCNITVAAADYMDSLGDVVAVLVDLDADGADELIMRGHLGSFSIFSQLLVNSTAGKVGDADPILSSLWHPGVLMSSRRHLLPAIP